MDTAFGIPGFKAADNTRHDAAAHRDGGAHMQQGILGGRAHTLLHLIERRDDVAGIIQHLRPGRGNIQPAGQPLKNPHAIGRLDIRDGLADGRLGDV